MLILKLLEKKLKKLSINKNSFGRKFNICLSKFILI
jgi:hypothetical protein